jgi:hypothetical protein
LPRRKTGAKREPKAIAATPTGYRTFSRKLAPGLTATGGVLAALGGLGAWIRATQVVTEGLAEEEVAVVMGHTSDWGRVIGVLGGVAAVASFAWLMSRLLPKLVSILVSAAVIALAVWRLPLINGQAQDMAANARSGEIDFISFHAGFGWGAWCLIAGCVALALGAMAGVLRELDLRRGVQE